MPNQDVIQFPPTHAAEEHDLAQLFQKQAKVSLMACELARLLYEARMAWIGGHGLAWSELSLGQRAGYRNEIERLIKRAKGEV